MDKASEDTRLLDFIMQSNAIEGLYSGGIYSLHEHELRIYSEFMALAEVSINSLVKFIEAIFPRAENVLRDKVGMNISSDVPPGGPYIVSCLTDILLRANAGQNHPFAIHVEYERLCPFFPGCNGLSGRALWAWQMRKMGNDPFALPFLEFWYRQSLELWAKGGLMLARQI